MRFLLLGFVACLGFFPGEFIFGDSSQTTAGNDCTCTLAAWRQVHLEARQDRATFDGMENSQDTNSGTEIVDPQGEGSDEKDMISLGDHCACKNADSTSSRVSTVTRYRRWAGSEGVSTGPWMALPEKRDTWMFPLYAEAVASATALNARQTQEAEGSLDAHYLQYLEEVESDASGGRGGGDLIDVPFPVFLLNLEHRTDRREYMVGLLGSVGFTNVSVHNAISWKGLDWDQLVAEERVDATGPDRYNIAGIHRRHGEATALKFAANALNHYELHSQALEEGLPLYAIFEDDLLPASALPEVNRRIVSALDHWPADGDTLYLEMCFDQCSQALYSAAHPTVFRAASPHCTAAVVYRQRAAGRIVRSIRPAFKSIDGMLAAMVGAGALAAYVAVPLAFFQDPFFGSDIAGRAGSAHGVSGVVCSDMEELLVQDTELRFVAVARRLQNTEHWALPEGGLHRQSWGWLGDGEAVVYYTQSHAGGERFSVEVMTCRGRANGQPEDCTWKLQIREESVCYGVAHVCTVEMVREAADGSEVQSVRKLVLVQRQPLGTRTG